MIDGQDSPGFVGTEAALDIRANLAEQLAASTCAVITRNEATVLIRAVDELLRLRAGLSALDERFGHFAAMRATDDYPMSSIIGDFARTVKDLLGRVGPDA